MLPRRGNLMSTVNYHEKLKKSQTIPWRKETRQLLTRLRSSEKQKSRHEAEQPPDPNKLRLTVPKTDPRRIR